MKTWCWIELTSNYIQPIGYEAVHQSHVIDALNLILQLYSTCWRDQDCAIFESISVVVPAIVIVNPQEKWEKVRICCRVDYCSVTHQTPPLLLKPYRWWLQQSTDPSRVPVRSSLRPPKSKSRRRRRCLRAVPRSACSTTVGALVMVSIAVDWWIDHRCSFVNVTTLPGGKRRMWVIRPSFASFRLCSCSVHLRAEHGLCRYNF